MARPGFLMGEVLPFRLAESSMQACLFQVVGASFSASILSRRRRDSSICALTLAALSGRTTGRLGAT